MPTLTADRKGLVEMSTGKWAIAGVPHKGWVCVDIKDLGEVAAVCEMCEVVEIRYVHHMEHKDYPEVLGCGCICAGHMEDDLIGARTRENNFKNNKARRQRWLSRRWYRNYEYISISEYRWFPHWDLPEGRDLGRACSSCYDRPGAPLAASLCQFRRGETRGL
jgi:hypothetical protein